MKMNDKIFNLFTILHPKKQKYPSSSKLGSKKKKKKKSFPAIVLFKFEKQSVKKVSQINFQAYKHLKNKKITTKRDKL